MTSFFHLFCQMLPLLKDDSDNNVYGDLDASKTLLLHGLESDFIEEQMSEDADFRYNKTDMTDRMSKTENSIHL